VWDVTDQRQAFVHTVMNFEFFKKGKFLGRLSGRPAPCELFNVSEAGDYLKARQVA